ncbi:NAD-dependent epimerase/dehydratase family protein [Streptomyces sp. NPDC098781]|uniref:NAD-dependent epimerase/dehydratase family protein n=1 Tax=Streptomyces sp. NPDC098781 TaxID=3366097 RepID=UPI00382F6BCD
MAKDRVDSRSGAAAPLVTVLGASGFIGAAVTAALVAEGTRVRAVSRRPAPLPAHHADLVETRTADLTGAGSLAGAVDGSDAVVNLCLCDGGWRAAKSAVGERVNVGVMRDLLTWAAHQPRGAGGPPVVVQAGAVSQIGVPPEGRRIDGTEPDEPVGVYARQKLVAEQALKAATRDGVVRGVALRLSTVFGDSHPRVADRGVVATMIRRALAGESLTMWHDGTVARDLVYVHDVAAAVTAALRHADALGGRHWLVGAGESLPLREVFTAVAGTVARYTGKPAVPVVGVDAPADAPLTDFRDNLLDVSAFRAATGWRPRVPFHQALENTVAALAGQESRP